MHAPLTTPDLKQGAHEVIELLNATMERARIGDIVHLCIVATSEAGAVHVNTTGSANHQMQAFFGLSILQDEIKNHLVSRHPPTKDIKLTADYACYNIAGGPCSFDFIPWLVEREMRRVAEGAPFPLKIYFHFGPDNDREFALQYASRKRMFENVIRPSIRFIGAVEDEKAIGGIDDLNTYSFAPVIERVKNGEKVPQFKSVCTANNNGPKPVVITLREALHSTGRNSKLDEWIKFGRWLQNRGERVLFLRDTDKAAERLEDFELCPAASIDIDVRMALYLGAKCNLFVSNGPVTLAFFTQVPWMLFHYPDPADGDYLSTPECWRKYVGIGPGEQFPWSTDKQRVVWEPPVFENMTAAWEAMFPL